jgi:hypothetical protein
MKLSQTIRKRIDFFKNDLLNKEYWAMEHNRQIYSSQNLLDQNSIELTMGWNTLYITGKSDFREEVRERLEDSKLDFMPGYTGTLPMNGEVHDLYWVNEKIALRQFKEAVGSKLIWKYRLKFYPSLEAFIESQNHQQKNLELSKDDLALLAEIKAAVHQES